MKIEELHEILKKYHKKYVNDIETITNNHPPFNYKKIDITKKNLTITITQIDGKDYFKFWIQNNKEGCGCTIGDKMAWVYVKRLVDEII